MELERQPPREKWIIELVAFLGRYGRQPRSEVMNMPITEALALADAVAVMMREEQASKED